MTSKKQRNDSWRIQNVKRQSDEESIKQLQTEKKGWLGETMTDNEDATCWRNVANIKQSKQKMKTASHVSVCVSMMDLTCCRIQLAEAAWEPEPDKSEHMRDASSTFS